MSGEGDFGCLPRFRLYSYGMNNPLRPSLNTPNIISCIARCDTGTEAASIRCDDALRELATIQESLRACLEQMERSGKALDEVSNARMKLVDQLCDIRDTLKAAMQDTSSFASDRRQEAIKAVLKKHFSLDLDK